MNFRIKEDSPSHPFAGCLCTAMLTGAGGEREASEPEPLVSAEVCEKLTTVKSQIVQGIQT